MIQSDSMQKMSSIYYSSFSQKSQQDKDVNNLVDNNIQDIQSFNNNHHMMYIYEVLQNLEIPYEILENLDNIEKVRGLNQLSIFLTFFKQFSHLSLSQNNFLITYKLQMYRNLMPHEQMITNNNPFEFGMQKIFIDMFPQHSLDLEIINGLQRKEKFQEQTKESKFFMLKINIFIKNTEELKIHKFKILVTLPFYQKLINIINIRKIQAEPKLSLRSINNILLAKRSFQQMKATNSKIRLFNDIQQVIKNEKNIKKRLISDNGQLLQKDAGLKSKNYTRRIQ